MMNSKVKGSASQCTSYAGLTRVSRRPAASLDARIKSAHDGAPENAVGSKRLIPSTMASNSHARVGPSDEDTAARVRPRDIGNYARRSVPVTWREPSGGDIIGDLR